MTNTFSANGFHHDDALTAEAPASPTRAALCGQASDELDAAVYRHLLGIVADRQPVQIMLTQIARLAAQTVPGAAEVSVTLVDSGVATTVAFSGSLAPALDERQYEAGAGPCVHAALTGQMISIDDTSSDTRFPEFSRQAHRHGVKHVLAVGLTSIEGTTGAINCYGFGTAGPFLPATRRIATVFADAAGIVVMNALVLAQVKNEAQQMREAMASRATIEQAKGIIMAQNRCTETESFEVLRTRSMHGNRKLRDVAQDLVRTITKTKPSAGMFPQ
jgi:GAF domain-containing protein